MKEKEILAGILAQYFKYSKYTEAIKNIKNVLNQKDSLLYKNWDEIKQFITQKKFNENEPLQLIAIDANLSLDEDSDEEAYKWLNLLIGNLETDDDIIEY